MATAVQLPVPDRTEAAGIGWQDVQDVSCLLAAEIPVRGFAVRDLLLLQAGTVVNSKEKARGRVGLHVNGSFIAWAELEVINGRLGIRLTDLE
jgi:flagellar motor switch/type III secretory pathway protein FliN